MYEALFMQLSDFEKSFLQDADSVDAKEVSLKQIESFLNWMLYRKEEIPYTEEDWVTTKKLLDVASLVYNTTGERIMSDENYDLLYELYDPMNRGGSDIVGAPNTEGVKTEKHRYPDLKGTLTKIYSIHSGEHHNTGVKKAKRSLEEWVSYIENKLGRPLTNTEARVMIQPKYDGVSIIFSFDEEGKLIQALTRGDKDTGEGVVVTDAFTDITFSSQDIQMPCGVKTEVIMPFDCFEEAKEKYGYLTPLSAVSGIINGCNGRSREDMKWLRIKYLRYQEEGNPEIAMITDDKTDGKFISLTDYTGIQKRLDEIAEMRKDLPIDGAVFILMDKELQSILGRENDRCVYEVAYKFPPEEKKSTLLRIDWQMGLLGNMTPVAKVEPVEIRGKNISSISLGSVDRFLSLDLHEGDEVIVKYDVIPYMETIPQEHTGNPFQIPTDCPICKESLTESPLRCSNLSCPSRKRGKILNFIRKVGIADISDATIGLFYTEGLVNEIWDLYDLHTKIDTLLEMPGFGKRSVENLLKEIDDHRFLKPHVLLGSLGIPNVGRRTFELVMETNTLEELQSIAENNDMEKLTCIRGISDKTAEAIINGLMDNRKTIQKLLERITLDTLKIKEKYHTTVYFTKCKDPKFAEFLKMNGVLVSANFDKKVDYLIIKDKNSDSKKIGKYDIPVMTMEEAFGFFDYGPLASISFKP